MKISIITVCKNTAETIEETLQSVINQTYKNFEIIVIDGKSTDKTPEIIDKYREHITYFVSEPDGGIYHAMNKGIRAATGNIFFFLNANDYLYDKYIFEEVIPYFKKNKHLDFLFGNVQFINDRRKDIHTLIYNNFKRAHEFTHANMCHQVIFYRGRVFTKYGLYDENYSVFGDYEMNVRLLVKHKLKAKYINRFISRYQVGGISDTMIDIGTSEKELICNTYFKCESALKFYKVVNMFFMKYLCLRVPYKLSGLNKLFKFLMSSEKLNIEF